MARSQHGLATTYSGGFLCQAFSEGLRAGDGSFADCRWSDVDAHCDGDENLRMVLEYILQAVHTFLSEALSMPEPSRRQRLRLLQEEIRSRGVALLKGADAPPWGQAVRTLIEVLTTATCKQSRLCLLVEVNQLRLLLKQLLRLLAIHRLSGLPALIRSVLYLLILQV